VWGQEGAGYEQRWPADWRTYLKAKLKKMIVCVTNLMDHVVAESIKTYAGTPRANDFRIFHGGLSAWWEAGAQGHMTGLGMANRQIRNTTANVGARYEFKIVGDSPEMHRGLDSHGFADLKASVMTHASYTSVYPDSDEPRRFNLGTPAEVFRIIERAWAVAPTSKRICEDILMLPFVLEKILAAQDTTVEDRALRHGRHKAKHRTWGSVHQRVGPLVNKPRSFQRIEALASSVPLYPDVEPERKWIAGGGKGPLLL
jgi:hypothetical protein